VPRHRPHVNRKDYSDAHIDAWAPYEVDLDHWRRVIENSHFLVATSGGMVVGLCQSRRPDYVDQLFVHKDLLRKRHRDAPPGGDRA